MSPGDRRGIAPRVLQSWRAPGRVVRGLRGMPESAMVVLLLAAMLIFWVAQWPLHARAAQLDPATPLSVRMGGAALAVMFLMPLVAYAVAGLVGWLSRLTGRPIRPRDSRLALFWALLAVSPAMLLTGLVAGFVGPGTALTLLRVLSGLAFLVIWGAGLRALSGQEANV